MDIASMVIGIAIGIVGTVIAVALTTGGRGVDNLLERGPLRVTKEDLRCRECGTQMKERFPNSSGARRHVDCPACGRFDSYIDHDLVRQYGILNATPGRGPE